MDYKTEAQPKATAGGVPVFCAHDAIVAIEKLIPNPKNPNTHPDAQIQALGRIIRQTGWRAPITVSKRSGFIVKGHGRLTAAKLEGLTEVPVDYQNYTNEAEEYADLVADNRIAELAEIDNKLLSDIFADIDTGEIPMELTGYTDKEVESLIIGLTEALHEDTGDQSETPENGDSFTKKGDLWIVGNQIILCTDEEHLCLLATNSQWAISDIEDTISNIESVVSCRLEPQEEMVDEIVKSYIKATGKASGIRLFRKGKELGREHFERMFTE